MRLTRRSLLLAGGGGIAALAMPRAAAAGTVEIAMGGRPDGARVWFDPVGLSIRPGQTVRWVNRDSGNSHTATAYHPAIDGRPRRIPEGAEPWDSGYLLPGEAFSVALVVPGVYDYYCIPHEMAGMVGRIVVGTPERGERHGPPEAGGEIPRTALDGFPPVEEIMRKGTVRSP